MVKDITSNDLDVLLKGDKKVFVDFYADWCGPCRMVEPIINDLSNTYDGQVEFVKVNVDEQPDVAAKYGVRSIPVFFILEKTSVLFKHSGAAPKTFFEDKIRIILR